MASPEGCAGQLILEEAVANTVQGSVLWLARGRYALSSAIVVDKSFTVRGNATLPEDVVLVGDSFVFSGAGDRHAVAAVCVLQRGHCDLTDAAVETGPLWRLTRACSATTTRRTTRLTLEGLLL